MWRSSAFLNEIAGTGPAMTNPRQCGKSVHQIDVEDRQLKYIRPAVFLDLEKQDRDEFLADINFKRVRLFRARHDTDIVVGEFVAQVGIERRYRLDARVVADLDHHAEIVGTLALVFIDGELAKIICANENFSGIGGFRHDADLRIAEQLFQIPVDFSDFLGVHGPLLISRQRLCLIGQPGASDPSTVEHNAVEHLVHGAGRLRAAGLAHDFRRNAGDGDIVRYRLDDNRAGRDARAMADLDIPENFRARANHDATPDFRMTVLVLLAGTAKCHIMQDRNVVLDHRRLAHDKTRRMVEENAATDFRSRIDVTLEYR